MLGTCLSFSLVTPSILACDPLLQVFALTYNKRTHHMQNTSGVSKCLTLAGECIHRVL